MRHANSVRTPKHEQDGALDAGGISYANRFNGAAAATEIFFALPWGDLHMRYFPGLSLPPRESEVSRKAMHAAPYF
jgi:hypothetical protein